ncbi:MAG: XRE family transcriptional regulator [Desulfobacteraceae bacterium]|nr:MAG: XRE family transcriptional regulator [Desulfobacteraceae bacterium]
MTLSTQEELKKLGIGRKIRSFREEGDMTLEDLAQKANITAALMSQIEQDVVPPTLATLINISHALGKGMDSFFVKDEVMEKVEVTRTNERLSVSRSRESDTTRMTYNFQALSYRLKDKQMETFFVEFDSTVEENPVPLSHEGEEFCYCLEGEIEFITDDRKIRLTPGDSLHFYSNVPHVLRGVGPGNPKAVFVLLPDKEG